MPSPKRRYPDSPVFYRSLTKTFPRITRGKGCWLYDDRGRSYLDACGGAFVANLGHGAAEIAEALSRQARKIAYVNGTAFTSEPAEELAAELAALNPKGLDKAYFLSSGSEAVEAALKLARQFWVESGRPGKHKIIARSPGYHGNTMLALSASARGHYRKFFGPWLIPVVMIPAPYPYRCPCGGRPPECPACSGQALEEAILKEGPETVAAFIAEPVGGSSTGASVPPPGYWRRVREICDAHGVLLIADEVLTGAGRTGTWTALERFGAVPDIMTLGKGLSGGYVPLSAVVTSSKILAPLARGSGSLAHAQTFSHSPLTCAAGLAAVRLIKRRRLVARADRMGRVLQEGLRRLAALEGVGDARGLGLLAGVEFAADKGTKAPFSRGLRFAETFVAKAQEAGLIVWPNVGHADGERGDLAMIAPPFSISASEIAELAERFETALKMTIIALKRQSHP